MPLPPKSERRPVRDIDILCRPARRILGRHVNGRDSGDVERAIGELRAMAGAEDGGAVVADMWGSGPEFGLLELARSLAAALEHERSHREGRFYRLYGTED